MKSLSFKQDLVLKVASLLLSLLLWGYVQTQKEQELEIPISLPVTPTNIPDELVITGNEARADFMLVGSPEVIETFQEQRRGERLRAFADVSSASEAGPSEFTVEVEPRSELAGLRFKGNRPPVVVFEFEEKASQEFPVEVETGGQPPEGFEFGTAGVSPTTVRLTGSKVDMGNIGSVRAVLSLSEIRPGASYPANVEVLDKRGRPMTDRFRVIPTSVTVTPVLTPAKPQRALLVSPRFNGQPAVGFQVERVTVTPPELKVHGDRADIARLSILETEPLSLAGLNRTQTFRARVRLPSGVQVEGNRGANVQVRVEIRPTPTPPSEPPGNP